MNANWSFSNDKPIYMQIVEQVKRMIVSGEVNMGDKLDSVRDIAFAAKVNPNTVQRALSELERTGLVYTQRTNGRFITDDGKLIQEMREELAQKEIDVFLDNMRQLGFEKDKAIELLKNKEDEK